MSEKPLTSKQKTAAALCAADELTDAGIAAQVGITERTIGRWKKDPRFLDAVNEHTARVQAAMLQLDIAKRHKRVAILDSLLTGSLQIIEERAAVYARGESEPTDGGGDLAQDTDPDGEPWVAPGASTGLLVRQVKIIGTGNNAMKTIEYQVDTGLVKQIESLMDKAASELGQKVDKVAVTGDVVIRRYVGVAPEDV